MSDAFTNGLKRFIFWDYARATWQYDVMVAIILAFIFLTPREKFGDQPRIPRASNIALLPGEHGSSMYWIDPELLPNRDTDVTGNYTYTQESWPQLARFRTTVRFTF